jgi:hypothetical protein
VLEDDAMDDLVGNGNDDEHIGDDSNNFGYKHNGDNNFASRGVSH